MAKQSGTVRPNWRGRKGKLSRRSVLRGMTAGTVAGLTMKSMGPFVRNAEAARMDLRILWWPLYEIPDTVKAFEKEHDVRVTGSYFRGNAEAFTKMRLGGTRDFDLVMADGFWPRQYYKEGLVQPIDHSTIPNHKGAYPEFLPDQFKPFNTPDGKTTFAVPNCWGGYGITYNVDKIAPEHQNTLEVMFNEKYADHLATSAQLEENIAIAGLVVTERMGTKNAPRPDGLAFNPYVLTDEELEECKKLLIHQKKLLVTLWSDDETLERLMRGQVVWASPDYAVAFNLLKLSELDGKLPFKVDYLLNPKEGGLGWVDSWMISSEVNDSEKLELCYSWINNYLTTENMIKIVLDVQQAPTIDVREHIPDRNRKLLLLDKTEAISSLHMLDLPSSLEKWERIWSEVQAA